MMDNNFQSAQAGPATQKAGLKCPQCDTFIETSIFQLLTTNALICPKCHLRLSIDRIKSKSAFDALRKVQLAQENLDRKSRFSR